MNQTKIVFPGSFTNFHEGHKDILKRSAILFSKVYVLVLVNDEKDNSDTLKDRFESTKLEIEKLHITNVEVKYSNGKLVDMLKELETNLIVRGIRNTTDYQYERELLEKYKKDMKEIEAIFLLNNI